MKDKIIVKHSGFTQFILSYVLNKNHNESEVVNTEEITKEKIVDFRNLSTNSSTCNFPFQGDGRGLGHGFYQAMFLTKIGATLNINSTFTCFYRPINLVDFLCEYLQHDVVRDGNNLQKSCLFLIRFI